MGKYLSKISKMFILGAILIVLTAGVGFAGGGVSGSPVQKSGGSGIDYSNAKAMPLPQADENIINTAAEGGPIEYPGPPAVEPGHRGTGIMTPETLPAPAITEEVSGSVDEVTPQAYGTKNHPFTTSRVDVTPTANAVSKLYPFRAAGKLYFKIGADSYICSASLIKKGLAVTAAHCVSAFGKSQWYSNWQYVPALWGTTAPYGVWDVTKAYALTAYLNGTDSCAQAGVICKDDVAVLVITPKSSVYPGTSTGYFAYGVNGYGFAPTSPKITLINQLGYPASHDSGVKMQRTDSQGITTATLSNNTVWGSRMTGGSSGGPELVNLGAPAVLGAGTTLGLGAAWNVVVGVTSWGYTSDPLKEQGAAPFLSTNLSALITAACTAYPAACAP
jgi:V8-like Glu-specific endopeptidase